MSLLDSDAEELKRNAEAAAQGPSSGRKVNQSGLGVFKGLNKYKDLTAKYRTNTPTPDSPVTPANSEYPTVEQQRGTISDKANETSAKSVQSPSNVSADSVAVSVDREVSAKSVHGYEVSAPDSKSVQSRGEVGAEPGRGRSSRKGLFSDLATSVAQPSVGSKVSAKSVQLNQVEPAAEVAIQPNKDDSASIVGAKSVQSIEGTPSKSVQSRGTGDDAMGVGSANEAIFPTNASKSVQSRGEVSAKTSSASVAEQIPAIASERAAEKIASTEVSAKSVQSQSKVSAAVMTPMDSGTSVATDHLDGRETKPDAIEVDSNTASRVVETSFESEEHSDVPVSSSAEIEIRATEELSAKSVHTPSELRANSRQSQSKVRASNLSFAPTSFQSQGEVSSIVSAPVGAKLVQTQGSEAPLESITSLSGAQRIVLEFLYQRCLWSGAMITPPIAKQQLIEATGLPVETALSAIKRLRLKFIIDRHAYKDGKAGWTQYRISDASYRELLQFHQSGARSVQSPSNVGSKVSSVVSAESPNSSSSLIPNSNKTTNTAPKENPYDVLPDEWKSVDYKILEGTNCSFSKADIVAIATHGMLTPEQFQESLEHLQYDLKDSKKQLNRAVVFGVLKKKGAPWVSQTYLSNLEREVAQQVAAADRLKAAKESETRAKAQLEFQLWLSTQSEDEKRALAKELNMKNTEGPMFEAVALQHFQSKRDRLVMSDSESKSEDQSPEEIRTLVEATFGPATPAPLK